MLDIKTLIKEAHKTAISKGWHEQDRDFGSLIALMHSELSEALEDYRNGHGITEIYYECKNTCGINHDCNFPDDCKTCKHGKPCGIPIELGDCIIRIFDTCGKYGIDLEKAIELKMAYNKNRPYRHGGKRV